MAARVPIVRHFLVCDRVVVSPDRRHVSLVNMPDVSGATILGDGRVSLILDVGSLARRARH